MFPVRQSHHEPLSPEAWLREQETLFAGLGGKIVVPLNPIFGPNSEAIVNEFIKRLLPDRPSLLGGIVRAFGRGMGGDLLGAMSEGAGTGYANGEILTHRAVLDRMAKSMIIAQPAGNLSDQEKALYLTAARATATGTLQAGQWYWVCSHLAWKGGQAHLECPRYPNHKYLGLLRQHLRELLEQQMTPHAAVLATITQAFGESAALSQSGFDNFRESIDEGDRFFDADDLENSPLVNTDQVPDALRLGKLFPCGTPVGFSGNESILVCGGPGSGKSMGYYINNLLDNAGSAFVLDPKPELYDATAGYRHAKYGPVFRFAPTDPSGNTARYNPFDLIPRDPMIAPVKCEVLAYQLIPETNSTDPVWELSARQLCWAFATLTAITAPQNERNIPQLVRLAGKASVEEELYKIINLMEELGERYDIIGLVATAEALHGIANSDRQRESVLLNLRASLNIYANNPLVARAVSSDEGSSWTPQMLRDNPGMSVFICMKPSELETYSSLVRLMIKQHVDEWTEKPVPHGSKPLTMYFDEMPRLSVHGPFEPILHAQDLGRSFGLRMLMGIQSYGQLKQGYGERAASIVSNCQAAIFLQPGIDEIEIFEKLVGTQINPFNGEEKPADYIHNFTKKKYGDKAVMFIRGHQTAILSKTYAWQTHADKLNWPIDANSGGQ